MPISNPCISCGQPTAGTRCDTCRKQVQRITQRGRPPRKKANTTSRGYGKTWQNLSQRARALQPFCSDCGATTDLQADHSPQAWQRYEKGLPIRLQDIDVVCGACNRRRGKQRPDKGKGSNVA